MGLFSFLLSWPFGNRRQSAELAIVVNVAIGSGMASSEMIDSRYEIDDALSVENVLPGREPLQATHP